VDLYPKYNADKLKVGWAFIFLKQLENIVVLEI
jgi:hypothetical protein